MSALMAEWRSKKAREDERLLDQIRGAVHAGRLEIHTDQRMLDFQGSPVHSPWDHLVPLLVLMFAALGILLAAGVAVGIVGMTMGVFAHVYGVKHLVAWRIRSRATAYMLESALHWQQLWHLGGIVVLLKGTSEYCMAPKGDWRKFARRNLPEDPAAAAEAEAEDEAAEAPPAPASVQPQPEAPRAPVQEVLPP
ncbi:MAG: hypothetical protein ACM33T_14575 [Solirubrobacterales bacterium]